MAATRRAALWLAAAGWVLAGSAALAAPTVQVTWVSYRAWPSANWAQPAIPVCVAEVGLTVQQAAPNDPRNPIRSDVPDAALFLPYYQLPPLGETRLPWQRGGTVCIQADGQWRAPQPGPYWYPTPGIGELLEKQPSQPYPGQLTGYLAAAVGPDGGLPLRVRLRQDVTLPAKDAWGRALGGDRQSWPGPEQQVTVWMRQGVGELLVRLPTWNRKTNRWDGPWVEAFLRLQQGP